jgi:hypothetical protein
MMMHLDSGNEVAAFVQILIRIVALRREPCACTLQVTVAASPPFGGTQIDHLQLNSQVYLTPGFQVLGGNQKLGTLPDIISKSANRL